MGRRPGGASGSDDAVAELVAAAGKGDEQAWAQLVERYGGLVWTVARNLGLGAVDAADVSQTTWLRLLEHLDSLRDPERVGAWLAVTARNEGLRVLRLAGRQVPTDGDADWEERQAAVPAADAGLLTGERDEELRRALATLPSRCRDLLSALAGEPRPSYAEVSGTLGMPVGSIGPTRARCLNCLRRRHPELLELVEVRR